MKTRNKVLTLSLSAVLLVAASVLGTMAYLTSTQSVTNTFTVGKVGITLDEAKTNEYGVEVSGAERVTENDYKLIPGMTYVKDPTITVGSNSEDCYLFVKVENGISDIEGKIDADDAAKVETIYSQMGANKWKSVDEKTGIYYYAGDNTDAKPEKVSKGAKVKIFETFSVKHTVTTDDLESYDPDGSNSEKSIKITGYAIQQAGFENETAQNIWSKIEQ